MKKSANQPTSDTVWRTKAPTFEKTNIWHFKHLEFLLIFDINNLTRFL